LKGDSGSKKKNVSVLAYDRFSVGLQWNRHGQRRLKEVSK